MDECEHKIRLHGSALKWIAIITMFIDHLAAVFLGPGSNYVTDVLQGGKCSNTYYFMRYIGRMAFPLFCYLLIEGIIHTSNAKKYGIRLLLFAFVSEVPFDYAFSGKLYDPEKQNVFFTLFVGFAAVELIRKIQKETEIDIGRKEICLLTTCVFFAGLAEILKTDYSAIGVITILLMYFFHKNKKAGFTISILPLIFSQIIEIFCLVDIMFVRLYDGTRGKQMKYLFYIFYPGHLIVLGILSHVFGL